MVSLPMNSRKERREAKPKSQSGKPGKSSPASLAFTLSKASAPPKLHQKICHFKVKIKGSKPKPSDDDLVFATRGLHADAFFGASPVVASALDLRIGRDPVADRVELNMCSDSDRVEPELSTLQKTGSFYFASTTITVVS